jgi:hypothetical protein
LWLTEPIAAIKAYFRAKGAASSAEPAEADALLGEALAWVKNGWEAFQAKTQKQAGGRCAARNPTGWERDS